MIAEVPESLVDVGVVLERVVAEEAGTVAVDERLGEGDELGVSRDVECGVGAVERPPISVGVAASSAVLVVGEPVARHGPDLKEPFGVLVGGVNE